MGLAAASFGALTLSLVVSWLVHRKDVAGLDWWLAAAVGLTSGLGLSSLGHHVPEVISVELANLLYLGGYAALVQGHALFTGRRLPAWVVVGPLLLVAPPFLFFHLVRPDFAIRAHLVAVCAMGALATVAWLLFKNARGPERLPSLLGAICAAFTAATNLLVMWTVQQGAARVSLVADFGFGGLYLAMIVTLGAGLTLALVHHLLIQARLLHCSRSLVGELEEALANIRTLSGLLRQCAWCRRLKEEDGTWSELARYVANHTDALVSHGVCPDCVTKVFGEEAAE